MNETQQKIEKAQGEIVPIGEFLDFVLKPETELEEQIISDPEFQKGAMYGKPRPGHPEGRVVYHIAEVLRNVDHIPGQSDINRAKLRLVAFIHDTFKHKVDRKKSASGENHHAMIARRFAEKYIDDPLLLDIIEKHDEAYNGWCNGNRDGKWDKAKRRINALLDHLEQYEDGVKLYKRFYKCDNETGDKDQTNFNWFVEKVNERKTKAV